MSRRLNKSNCTKLYRTVAIPPPAPPMFPATLPSPEFGSNRVSLHNSRKKGYIVDVNHRLHLVRSRVDIHVGTSGSNQITPASGSSGTVSMSAHPRCLGRDQEL